MNACRRQPARITDQARIARLRVLAAAMARRFEAGRSGTLRAWLAHRPIYDRAYDAWIRSCDGLREDLR